jgi:hypothetical protein
MSGKDQPKRVVKKIGSSHVVWFPESNRWVEFREPAWYIYRLTAKNTGREVISAQLSKRYGLPENEAVRFLGEVTEGICQAARPPVTLTPGVSETTGFMLKEFRPHISRNYLINKRRITIIYGTRLLEYHFHRPLAHLGVPEKAKEPVTFGLYETGDEEHRFILRRDGAPDLAFKDAGMLRHSLYAAMASHIHNVSPESWMSYIHASAVTNCSEAVLLSSSSGSGKSTMAALLQSPMAEKMGCSLCFMSDDFVPVGAADRMAYLFPAALTVKEGSFNVISPVYDPEKDADSGFTGHADRQIRYLLPRFPRQYPYRPRIIRNIVFIRYDETTEFRMEKLPVLTALSLFHQEARVSHNPLHARTFIDWFSTLECYRMEYSDNGQAIRAVSGLFS